MYWRPESKVYDVILCIHVEILNQFRVTKLTFISLPGVALRANTRNSPSYLDSSRTTLNMIRVATVYLYRASNFWFKPNIKPFIVLDLCKN